MPSLASLSTGSTKAALPTDYSVAGLTNFTYNIVKGVTLPAPLPEAALQKSGPQGKVVPFTIIEDPSAWKAADLRARPQDWTYHVTQQDVAELDAALAGIYARGIKDADQVKAIGVTDFPLPIFGPKLRELASGAHSGRGFQLIRGIPVAKYKRRDLVVLWWGIGQWMGRVVPINTFGHLINHIKDLRASGIAGLSQRISNTNLDQTLHSDQFATDLVGLFAISKAKTGGESRWVSSISIHNELLRRGRKDLVEALTQRNFWISRSGYTAYHRGYWDMEKGEPFYVPVAPYTYHDGRLSVVFQSDRYYVEQQDPEVPRLTEIQLEALRTVQAIAMDPEFMMEQHLEPGDIQLMQNTMMMHSRNGFEDGEAPHEKRHLLRWWLDSSGVPPEEQRKRPALACFGERLTDPAGGWPQEPGVLQTIVLDTRDAGLFQGDAKYY